MKEPIVINAETREITVPETERAFGVAGERKVEVKHIRIEGRTVDGTDLTQGFSWKVSCENAGKELCADLIDGIVADAGNIEFDWIVGAAPMAYKGTLHFAVCAVRVDAAGNILQEWHSKLGTGDVANGIEATVQNIGGQDLLAHIQSITAAAQQNAAAAQRDAAAAAKSAEDAANSAAAAKDSEDAAARSATDATKSQSAAAASERNAKASKNLAATSESNASASASAAAASETAAKASANKAQALVEGIPDDYATALKDISRLKENKLDKPNNPVVGQLLRVKSISDTGEITLETVADNDDNKLPTGGSTGQVLAKKSDENFDAGWVNAVAGSLPKGGYPGFILQKKSFSGFDAEWVSSIGNYPSEVWKNKNNLDTFGAISIDIGRSIYVSGKRATITSEYILCYTDAEDISADYPFSPSGNKIMYTITVPGTSGARITDYSFKMQTARGYRYVMIDTDVSYGLMFSDGFNMQGTKDNSVAIPYIIFARYEQYTV